MTDQIMYHALLRKDRSYEGLFFAAVKTTGVFCRPTCTARKPKKENVEFFKTSKEAMLRGYRPCKLCHPLASRGRMPVGIENLIAEIHNNPGTKLKDHDLRGRGLEPAAIRRWFLKHHGMTFHAYQRLLRINTAFQKIREGESVTTSAFDSGYESLSGFQESFQSVFGMTPTRSRAIQILRWTRFETPLGEMMACVSDRGLCLLEFAERKMLETELKSLARLFDAEIVPGDHALLEQTKQELREYFDGRRENFTVPLDFPGTPFQQEVWRTLLKIPYGTTWSYTKVSQAIGKPNARRAVARANGMNRIAIIIPCHRVIGENGHLTGYGGGVWRKQKLLEIEGWYLV